MTYWKRLQWAAGIGFAIALGLAAWLSDEPTQKPCADPSSKVRCMPEIR
jgi:hypothetical protein